MIETATLLIGDCQDHYFDVITNVVGLVAAVLGDKYYWWIDPFGAIILAVYTISNWTGTVVENAGILPLTLVFLYFSDLEEKKNTDY